MYMATGDTETPDQKIMTIAPCMSVMRCITANTGLMALAILMLPGTAIGHVSEQGLVLLLPTDFYILSGVLVVILTLLLVVLLPASWSVRLFRSSKLSTLPTKERQTSQAVTSLLSLLALTLLLWLGYTGTRDPLENLLPLVIWTVWWIGLPILQGLFGDIWQWLNPWIGVSRLFSNAGWRAPFSLPEKIGYWPGILLFLLFISFALADIAPDAPRRLTFFVGGYWCFTLLCMLLFGEEWLKRGECFSILMHRFSQLSTFGARKSDRENQTLRIGLPGWKLLQNKAASFSSAVFILVLLGCGSFDGLNETFTWLAMIGINPLEFPGRSVVVKETVIGLLGTNLLLVLVYGLCVFLGLHYANRNLEGRQQVKFLTAFCALAISVLPIAYAYHFAHFLVSFLINGQYTIAAISDPLHSGANLLNLKPYFVTTGFMNSHGSVEFIWLTQALAVVFGHVISVLLAHAVAVELYGNARRAIVSQVPLAVFMVGYTFIGLWLLAAPKGA